MKTNAGRHTSRRPNGAGPGRGGRPSWSQPLSDLVSLLGQHRVTADALDANTTRFQAVPVGDDFNKERTNVLLHRLSPARTGAAVFIDQDLEYHGPDSLLIKAFTGGCMRSWRRLVIAMVPGDVNRAFYSVLNLLRSPIAEEVREVLESAGQMTAEPPEEGAGEMLAAVGEPVLPDLAAEAFERTLRKDLAVDLAIILSRPEPPNSAVLWGDCGVGKDLLMQAAVHPLLEKKQVSRVVRIPAANVSAGSLFPAEVDGSLLRVFSEARAIDGCVLLIPDLDVCLTGSPVSRSLVCEAADHGVRFLATVRSEDTLVRLGTAASVARRIVPIHVAEPSRAEVVEVLQQMADASPCPVAPAAIHTILKLAHDEQTATAQPALSIGLLQAAIGRATWHGTQVDPDVVFAVRRGEWPENLKEL